MRQNPLRKIFFVLFILSSIICAAQDIKVEYAGIISPLYLEEDIIINSRLNKKGAVIIVHFNKKVKIDFDVEILKQESLWNKPTLIYYVPASARTMIVERKDWTPFFYDIPVELEIGKIYSFNIDVIKQSDDSSLLTSATTSDIKISDFRINPSSLIGSSEPIYDNAGNACAVIRYFVNDDDFVIAPNLGVLKTIRKPGMILQYVPTGTKRLSISNGDCMPLNGFEIPMEIESKITYDANVQLSESAIKRRKASPDNDEYLGIGYNGKMTFAAGGERKQFVIHSNNSWTITSPSWCVLSDYSGNGNKEITIKVKSNTQIQSRNGRIIVKSEGVETAIDVEQEKGSNYVNYVD